MATARVGTSTWAATSRSTYPAARAASTPAAATGVHDLRPGGAPAGGVDGPLEVGRAGHLHQVVGPLQTVEPRLYVAPPAGHQVQAVVRPQGEAVGQGRGPLADQGVEVVGVELGEPAPGRRVGEPDVGPVADGPSTAGGEQPERRGPGRHAGHVADERGLDAGIGGAGVDGVEQVGGGDPQGAPHLGPARRGPRAGRGGGPGRARRRRARSSGDGGRGFHALGPLRQTCTSAGRRPERRRTPGVIQGRHP